MFSLSIIAATQLILECKAADDRLIGEWGGISSGDNPHIIYFTFDKDHFASVRIGSARIGGKNQNLRPGENYKLSYKVDYSKTPYTIQYTSVINDIPNKEPYMRAIFRFISDNKLEIRMWLTNEERYTNFDSSDKESEIILERTK